MKEDGSNKLAWTCGAIILGVVSWGCEPIAPSSPPVRPGALGVDMDTSPAPPPPPPAAAAPANANDHVSQAPSPAPPPAPVREKAEAGVGAQGRGYGGGILVEPAIRARFLAGQRLVFNQVTHALNLYEAEHGQKPATHEAFMKDIIQANRIELPRLPEEDRYIYDPERGELMVEHQQ